MGELAWVAVDGRDEGGGGLAEELVELFKVLEHLWDRVYHVLCYNSN